MFHSIEMTTSAIQRLLLIPAGYLLGSLLLFLPVAIIAPEGPFRPLSIAIFLSWFLAAPSAFLCSIAGLIVIVLRRWREKGDKCYTVGHLIVIFVVSYFALLVFNFPYLRH